MEVLWYQLWLANQLELLPVLLLWRQVGKNILRSWGTAGYPPDRSAYTFQP